MNTRARNSHILSAIYIAYTDIAVIQENKQVQLNLDGLSYARIVQEAILTPVKYPIPENMNNSLKKTYSHITAISNSMHI